MTKDLTQEDIEEALVMLPDIDGTHESATLNYWGCKALPTVKRAARMGIDAHARAETFEDVLALLLRDVDPAMTGDVLREKPARELADLVYATVTRERHEAAVMRGGLAKANAARLAAEHDRDEARAAEEHMRQERDAIREALAPAYIHGENDVATARRVLASHIAIARAREMMPSASSVHLLVQSVTWSNETNVAKQILDLFAPLQARIADLEARLAGPTQGQRDDEADMRAFQVGG